MRNTKITVFKNLFKSTDVPYTLNLSDVLERIREGKKKDLIDSIRSAGSKEEYEGLKKALPAILFQGVFTQRNDDSCSEPSGLMITDYDKFPSKEKMEKIREIIVNDPTTVAAFKSPGGNGIKAVIRIPKSDKKSYKAYFKAYHQEKQYPYFDISNSNISRVCFESYDPDIYINYDAEEFAPEINDEGYSYDEKIPLLPIDQDEQIVERIMQWNWKRDFVEGERNNFIFDLAGTFREYGVSESYCINYLQNNVSIGDFSKKELERTVKSAYKIRHPHKYFEDYKKKEEIQAQLSAPKKEIVEKYGIDEQTYDNLRDEYDHENFWYFENKKPKIDNLKFKFFLERNGFKKYYPEETQKPIWVKITSNKVKEISVDYIKDFVMDHLMEKKEFAVWRHCSNFTKLFSENNLTMLETIQLQMLPDTKNESFVAYENGILRVAKNKVELIDYIDVEGYIWESQIIKREFKKVEDNDNDYKKFIYNISNFKPEPIECVIGYLLHGYKNKTYNKAIIINDEVISDNPEGGTGKGLFIQGIRQIRKVAILDGKSFDDKKSFPYQTVSRDTEVMVFDDVKRNFDFESKFSLVTEGITLERKNKDALKLPVEESPKIVITTNYAIKGEGNSHDRRRHEIEVSQYYSKDITPFLEFGRQLFDDWNEDDYVRFDNYMAACIQHYLNKGLLEQDAKNIKKRKFIAETSYDFLEWIEDRDNFPLNTRLDKSEKFTAFTSEYKDFQKWLTRKRFLQWVEKYSKYMDLDFSQGKSMTLRWVMLSDGNEEVEQEVDF